MVGWHHQIEGHESEQTPEMVKERESWHAAVHVSTENWTQLKKKKKERIGHNLVTEQQQW